jgi:glyoxylase-like metal-dependent hydrolase (beta-lactamase superfamily II)
MFIGKFQIDLLDTRLFSLDGGAMFGVVPKPLWSKAYHPGDAANRIPLAARPLLVRWDDHVLLIDVGNGTKMNDKFRQIYGIDLEKSSMDLALRPFGLKAADVTDVILSHLHFDHAGGSTLAKNGKVVPTFPNARYYVQKDHLKWAQSPCDKDAASFLPDNFLPLKAAGMLTTLEGEGEIYPGIAVKPLFGHTRAMQVVIIHDAGRSLLYCADLIPTCAHIQGPFIMGYDNHPLITLDEKKSLLSRAYEENWLLVFEHDAFIQAATIEPGSKGFKPKEQVEITPAALASER